MEVQNVLMKNNTFEAKFSIPETRSYQDLLISSKETSPEYVLNGVTLFQVRVVTTVIRDKRGCFREVSSQVIVKFTKRQPDNFQYRMLFTSAELCVKDKKLTTEDGPWFLVHEGTRWELSFQVKVRVELVVHASSFATLYDESEMSDFELRGIDGNLSVHRAVLAASSPVFYRMLAGNWSETKQGQLEFPDVTAASLRLLKDYLYLGKLPDTNLEEIKQLVLISSRYLMPELEQHCICLLVGSVLASNVTDMIEFAAQHKLKRLTLGILHCVHSHIIDINDIDKQFEQSVNNEEEEEPGLEFGLWD